MYLVIILAVLLAIAGAGWGGYQHGKKVCQGEHAVEQIVEIEKDNVVVGKITKADAANDKKSAAKTKTIAAQKEVVIKEVIRHVEVLRDDPKCHLAPERMRNIWAAIDGVEAPADQRVEAPLVDRQPRVP